MLIMGLNMLGLIPFTRYFSLRLPSFVGNKIEGKGPLVIGFLNGFLPCGPLQAMQLYALSTGSPVSGGISMFLFCLGTIPLMFLLGATGSILSGLKGKSFSRKAMQVGAVLVASMGVVMLMNVFFATNLSASIASKTSNNNNSVVAVQTTTSDSEQPVIMGCPCCSPIIEEPVPTETATPVETPKTADTSPPPTPPTPPKETVVTTPPPATEPPVQVIYSTLDPRRYPSITVKKGIPVRWLIEAPPSSIHGCNNRIFIPEYDIEYTFKYGENVIEFTPTKEGSFRYSCWMYMMFGNIVVES
jgi:hypothetical protein